MKVGKKKLR